MTLPRHPHDTLPTHLLGKRVEVFLGRKDGRAVIVTGKLLGFGDCGEFEVEDTEGCIHYCWPMLETREIK